MPVNLENSAVATGLEKVSFHSNPKEAISKNVQIVLISHASKVMLKILLAMANLDSALKSRHHFANKGPYSQSYGFASSHVGRGVRVRP